MDNILSFLPEFDDFRKLKSIHNSIKRVIGKSNKSRDGLGAAGQIKVRYYEQVICEYYIHYGVEFLREQVNLEIESVKFREVVNDYITKALEYRESERLAFEESVNSAGKSAYFDICYPFIPFTNYSVMALLSKYKGILPSKKLNSIYDFIMWYTDGELSVEGFNKGEPEYTVSGEFNLPWNFVSFMDGYMLLYHPMHPQGNFGYLPFRYNDVRCKMAFNSVKSYIIKKLKPIYATALNGKIVAVENVDELWGAIEYLYNTVSTQSLEITESAPKLQLHQGSIHNQDSSEVLKELKLHKSKYLDYLADIHLVASKIFYAVEARVNSNGVCVAESAFIFTLQQSQEHTLVVYENTLAARASICFIVSTKYYNEAIDDINSFFSSVNINKRELLIGNSISFNKNKIINYYRVSHIDFLMWRRGILLTAQ